MKLRPVVFLDRDGTINIERGHISSLEQFEILDGVVEAIRRLNHAGVAVVVVTNQSGIARGLFTENHVRAVHDLMIRLLGEQQARVDAIYFCPHLPDGVVPEYSRVCNCRKPGIGLIERAFAADLLLDRQRAFVVGDTKRDMGLALKSGARAIFVETGKDKSENVENSEYHPDHVASTLLSAVAWILDQLKLVRQDLESV